MKKKRRKINVPVQQPASNLQTRQPCWSPEKTTSSRWGERLSSAPDVPSGSNDALILESVTEENDKRGLLSSPFFKKGKAGGGPSDAKSLRFLHQLTDNLLVKWESVLLGAHLYVQLPTDNLHQGSRDSLVELLDVAEEQLGCSHVIIMFNRNRQDCAQLIRTFKFMGFETLPPTHKWVPPTSDHMVMAYSI